MAEPFLDKAVNLVHVLTYILALVSNVLKIEAICVLIGGFGKLFGHFRCHVEGVIPKVWIL